MAGPILCCSIAQFTPLITMHVAACWQGQTQANPKILHCNCKQVVNENGTLAWSPVVMHPSFHPDLPPIPYLRLTTAAGQVPLLQAEHCPLTYLQTLTGYSAAAVMLSCEAHTYCRPSAQLCSWHRRC
jgi:hypothetical protein